MTQPASVAPAVATTDRVRASLAHGGTLWMLAGSLIAAGGAYLFQVYTAQELGSRDYAPISVLWTMQYLLLSVVLYSIEAWALRAVARAGGGLRTLRRSLYTLAGLLFGLACVLGVASGLAADRLFSGRTSLAGAVALTVLTYGCFVLARGILAGRHRFKAYGLVTSLESMVRLVVAVGVVAAGGGVVALGWTMPVGALAAASFWLIARRRPLPGPPPVTDSAVPLPGPTVAGPVAERPGRFLLAAVPANACSQILLAGGPLVTVAIGAPPETTSTLFVVITVARLPLVVVQGGLLSRLLPTLSAMAGAGDRARLARWSSRAALGSLLIATVAGTVAAVIGPAILEFLYGSDFRPSAPLAAGSAVAVTGSAGAMLLNQVLIACRRETALTAPWALALLVAGVAVALAPGSASNRVITGMVVGQIVAVVMLFLSCRRQVARLPAAKEVLQL